MSRLNLSPSLSNVSLVFKMLVRPATEPEHVGHINSPENQATEDEADLELLQADASLSKLLLHISFLHNQSTTMLKWRFLRSMTVGGMCRRNSAPQWLMYLRRCKKLRGTSSNQTEASEHYTCFLFVHLCKNNENHRKICSINKDGARTDICAGDSADKHQSADISKVCARDSVKR